MATALQRQLAVIAANSTHQLDLKAQKQRHGKSLLFEPREAATQSFDTIYQICYEGFEELCMLDSRFAPFARNVFSEQSKEEDRTQMTAQENDELDSILHTFLGLVCGRLLLKPAVKAVEWLVRRFRVHEYNTETVLLTFLPYHSSHIFPALLSILPDELPPSFKFLHPYVASLQSPPRHTILSAATNNHTFFSAFSQYVLQVAKARHHSALLLGFWASITAQAANGMIDSTRTGRASIRKQREEDLLLRILPVLQSAVSIQGVQELYLGSCMIMTILATKASLEDNVLDAMMEAVVGAWTEETKIEGLTCLALLAEEKQQVSQSSKVTKALLKSPDTTDCLVKISQQHRVSKLVLFTAIAIIQRPSHAQTEDFVFLETLLDKDLLSDRHLAFLLERLLLKAHRVRTSDAGGEVWTKVSSLLESIATDDKTAPILLQAARNAGILLKTLDLGYLESEAEEQQDNKLEPIAIDTPKEGGSDDEFRAILDKLPQMDGLSFWAPEKEDEFKQYLHAFRTALSSDEVLDRLLCSDHLCRSRAADHPTFLSFAARAWCGNTPQAVRLKTLMLATEIVQVQEALDLQALMPYALAALADASQRVRKAAAELFIAVSKAYGDNGAKGAQSWASKTAYGGSTTSLHWQSSEDAHNFVEYAVIPGLEDCVLDAGYASRHLANTLNTDTIKHLKKSSRQAACLAFASHAVATPSLRVRLFVLHVLANVGKIASEGRVKCLIPFVREWALLSGSEVKALCGKEGIDALEMEKAVVGSASHRTTEELRVLQEVASGQWGKRPLSELAFLRLRRLWTSMNGDAQLKLTNFLLENATTSPDSTDTAPHVQTYALETLRNVTLPPDIVVHLIEALPSGNSLQDQPSAAKRRRTSGSQSNTVSRPLDQARLQDAIRQITLILELVEGSKPEQHPQLLKPLFHLLSELQQYCNFTGSELVYVQGVLLGCLDSVVSGMQQAGIVCADADRSAIRTDLIVDCVRTTSSPQIHTAALQLMSSLASWAPELVLHSVMPLFTFMSSTLMRQHDDFAAHVTDRTVATIVPPLARSLKKRGKGIVEGACELLLSFVAAFEHVPLHRRLGLFRHLIETLGADETLYAVVAMLVERYSGDGAGAVATFVAELADSFNVNTVLKASTQYLDLIFDALKSKKDRKLSAVLLGASEKGEDAFQESVDDLLEGLAGLLEGSTLRGRLAVRSGNEQQAEIIRSTYSVLLENTMQLTRQVSGNETLKVSADHLLAAVLGLMPTADFIDASAQLMQSGSNETRQQVFRSLEARVQQARRGDKESARVFIDTLPNCGVFIATSQPVATRHAAISCVDQICEKFGKVDVDAVVDVAGAVAGNAALGSIEQELRVISILCLASMVEVLGDAAVGVLPPVLTKSLVYMREEQTSEQLTRAGISLLNAVLDHLPWMLAGQYLDDALKLSAATEPRLASGLLDLIATKVRPQELFAAVERIWEDLLQYDHGAARAGSLTAVLQRAVGHHSKATVTRNAQVLFAVLLRAFDLRRELCDDDDEEDRNDELFERVEQLALSITLKLNDATFRPFFIRFVEWTSALPKKDVDGKDMRLMSLFGFTRLLFEELKSIVTGYASFVLDSAVAVLNRNETGEEGLGELVGVVLHTLSSNFEGDQDDFWQAPSHFEAVAEPLVTQLTRRTASAPPDLKISTITALAASSAPVPDHLKILNTKLMGLLRHVDAKVRLAAVQCQRQVTQRLTFDWLALLPEMLPGISEAQEDGDEAVEREVLRWVAEIEAVTGEGMGGMLA